MMNLTIYSNIFWINPYMTQKKALKSPFAVLKFEEIKDSPPLQKGESGGVILIFDSPPFQKGESL